MPYFRALWIKICYKQSFFLINSGYAFALWQQLMFLFYFFKFQDWHHPEWASQIRHAMMWRLCNMMWNFLLALSVSSLSNSCTMFNFCQFVSRRRSFTWAVQCWQDEGWTLLRIICSRKTRRLAADCQTSHESLSFVVSGDNLHSEAW